MIILTKRQKDILTILLDIEEYITYKELATLISCSSRSIRSDILMVEDFLKEYGCFIIKKPGNGIKLNCNYEIKRNIKKYLNHYVIINYSQEERKTLIILILLISNHTTFQFIADILGVSKLTVINHFDEVISLLKKEGLDIKKTTGQGLLLIGEESDIRKCFIEILANEELITINLINQITPIDNYIKLAISITQQISFVTKINFINSNRINIILAYILNRIDNNHLLNQKINQAKLNIDDASKVLEILKSYFPNFEERLYAASILLSERIEYERDTDIEKISEEEDAFKIAMYLIDSLKQLDKVEFKEHEMIEGLTKHLKSAIYRYRNHIHIKNDLLDQIKLSYSLMFEFTRSKLKAIENTYDLIFDENEIAFIVLYIVSIYESGVKDKITLDVLVVCSFGLATSTILKNRILSIIPDCRIMGPMSIEEATSYLSENKVDAIISTNEIPFSDVPIITVNPLLNQKDIERIKNYLHQYAYSKMCFNFFKGYSQEDKAEVNYISDYVKPDNIQIIDRIDDWKEAIRLAAKPLVDKNLLAQTYVETMIRAVKEYGTYMVLTPKTAYVHAGVDDGINSNCVAILLMRQALEFGESNIKKVSCIVVLGIKDTSENNLLNIAYILEKSKNISLLEDENISIEKILNMNTKEK